MGINKRYAAKFEKAYAGIPETIIPIEFMPNSPYYHMEEWREVLPMFVPDVTPHKYWVSSHGKVASKQSDGSIKIIKDSVNQKGYHQLTLQSIYGKSIGIKLAKLMMLHFRFVPGCHLMEVDHLDGNKDNNVLWNFEWVKPQENTHRAIKNNQRTIAHYSGYLDNNTVLLTDKQARDLHWRAVN